MKLKSTRWIAFLVVLTASGAAQQPLRTWTPVVPVPGTIVAISHRGEHLHHPENTLAAFHAAMEVGADFFELDVRTTSDGKLVLMHDGTVDRMTSSTGRVSDLTFDRIRSLDVGAKFSREFVGTKIPTLDEAFDLAHGRINVYVDTKDANAKLLVDTILRHDMQDHVVIFGNPFFLYEVQMLRPGLRIMPESSNVEVCRFLVQGLHPGVMAFSAADFKNDVIQVAKQASASIYVDRMGSTDGPEGWQAAIDKGARGIQTDRPAELVQYLRTKHLVNH